VVQEAVPWNQDFLELDAEALEALLCVRLSFQCKAQQLLELFSYLGLRRNRVGATLDHASNSSARVTEART